MTLGDLVAIRATAGAPLGYLTVVGLTRTPAALDAGILNRVNAYALPSEVASISGRAGPNQLLVRLPPHADEVAAADRLTRLLDLRGIKHGVVATQAEVVGSRELRTLIWLLAAFSLIGLILSAFLVANTVAATVHDEMEQIGVLKALGAGRRRVLVTYLAPALLLGAIATVAGYALGLGGGQEIVAFLARRLGYPTPPIAITPRELGLALGVGVGVPTVAAVIPALLGSRQPVATLMRSYGLGGPGGRLRRRRKRPLMDRWPLVTLGAANALRRRLRGGVTVVLIGVAVAAAIAAQALSTSLESTVSTLYARYGADLWVAFDLPADATLAATVGRDPGVVTAEEWARATGYANGSTIDLWALPARTTIYHYRLIAGHWLGAGGREAVASASLVRRLNLHAGDVLSVDVGHETREVVISGVVDDESTYLGSTSAGKLFLAPSTLASFNGQRAFSFLAVVFDRHDPVGVEAAIARLEERYASLRPAAYAAYSDKASTERTIAILILLLRAMVILVSLIGLIGVINTLAMGVAERRREIGVVRALGAGWRHLGVLLLVEGLALGATGYGLGVVIGFPLGRLLVALTGQVLFRLSFALPPSFLGLALAVTLAACGIAGLGPAIAAARVRPTTVLRYE